MSTRDCFHIKKYDVSQRKCIYSTIRKGVFEAQLITILSLVISSYWNALNMYI